MLSAVLTPALVSLIFIAVPVPALITLNPVALPLLVRSNEVATPRPDVKVKEISLPVVVVIVLPPTYADCRVTAALEHLTMLFEESIQIFVPAAVVSPVKLKNESASV